MQVGVHVPQWGPGAGRDAVLAVARAVEDAGLASVWVADHLVHPHHSATPYPYNPAGLPWTPEDGFLEAFSTLGVIAGATERIRLGTSVFVLPMRGPLEVAKVVATLDVLSGGRMILGVGAGWWKEEFDALDAAFAGRGRRMDEQLAILRALWRDGALEHHGEHYDFAELSCRPTPVQPGGPPIWIGGMGPTGIARAARYGDGWHAVTAHAPTMQEGLRDVRTRAGALGRDAGAITLSTSAQLPLDPERAIERLARFARIGVDHVVLNLDAPTADAACAQIAQLSAELLPAALERAAATSAEPV